jgi:hypothetical protein
MIKKLIQKREKGSRKKKTGLPNKKIGFDPRGYAHTLVFPGVSSCRGW